MEIEAEKKKIANDPDRVESLGQFDHIDKKIAQRRNQREEKMKTVQTKKKKRFWCC